ncbi:MAG: ribosomal protein S18-alanine N-acetyltransferase [Burkholderiales bacterium]|uniref:ribosomal protein S18-alanine N-acetyltransferase n=1 Tax=Ottowia sp. TaxID=1898956 RepID=UPI001AD10488|nr:ribosomal protein S18-alanine N-acetyltransferase [Ottowia sp.]MBN9407168.1 ribosomal protein S18-alanine N-acetyltransferase [Burkholderiales bacterium]MBS0404451.1 ribosomal protein S18-alanine N-acetyltransferase [Pseudomonadota bacterium]MBS0414090.1 ribosomal protein S18-alanine N-acetyltransferase [Pseudomonadota bacterium]
MSALPTPPLADALPRPPGAARFEPLSAAQLDAVQTIEQAVYSHPWSRGNFSDSVAAGYLAQCLWVGDELAGYFVAMAGYREVHLLNITVAPAYQHQGWARAMLDALALWSRWQQAEWLWLEVRASNVRAQQIYRQHGFAQVGLRKAYYPAGRGQREDAVVMNLRLADGGAA